MRKKLTIFFALVVLFASCGCAEKEALPVTSDNPSLLSMELPQNFTIMIRPEEITAPSAVKCYIGDPLKVNEEALASALNDFWPGKDFRIKCTEHSFSVIDTDSNARKRLPLVARDYPGKNTAVYAFGGALNNNDFIPWGDLDSLPPLSDVIDRIDVLFSAAGLDEFRAVEAYAMEASVLAAHDALLTEQHNSVKSEGEASMEVFPWSEDDSAYLILYASILDGLPIYTKSLTLGREVVTGSYACAVVSAEGLLELRGVDLYALGEAQAMETCMHPQEVLERFLRDMCKAIHREGTELVSMELCYLPIPEGRDKTELRPIWVFETGTPRDNPEEGHVDPIAYEKYLYDAVTGDHIEGR